MNKKTTFREWLAVVPFTDFQMQTYDRPMRVGKKVVPENLDDLTIGQLIELSTPAAGNESLYRIPEVILGMKRMEVERARAVEVVPFIGWVMTEVEKINKLFEKGCYPHGLHTHNGKN